jgi:gliding motility-associated-like protein
MTRSLPVLKSIAFLAATVCLSLHPSTIQAQLQVGTTMTPVELVQNVLVGSCVTVSNISFNGVLNPTNYPANIGSFTNGQNTNLGLASGVILSSGAVNSIANPPGTQQFGTVSPNYNADADLQALTGTNINNAAILEFDFVPNGDSISFRFVFGSEEYPEFVCSSFNDAFGFFLSGPGINGPFTNNAINIALIPGTEVPVSINTVNNGYNNNPNDPSCPAQNPEYFIINQGTTIVYDGMTVVLTAKAAVQCNEVHHIKLAIADASDSGWDSGVFLEAGSFSSVPYVPTLSSGQLSEGNTIYTSCAPVSIDFQRVSCEVAVETEFIYISYGGTATMGVDIFPALPETLSFEPGVNNLTITFNAPMDGDPVETLIITLSAIDCNGVLSSNEFTFFLTDPPPMSATGFNQTVQCGDEVVLTPTVINGFAPYTVNWSPGGGQGNSLTVTASGPATYTATITDQCNNSVDAQFTIGLLPLPPIFMNIIGSATLVEGCETAQVNIIRPQGLEGNLTINLATTGTGQNGSDFQLPGSVVIADGNFNVLVPFAPLDDQQDEPSETVTITGTFTDDCGRSVSATVIFTLVDAPAIVLEGNSYVIDCEAADSLLLSVNAYGGYNNQLTITWGIIGQPTGSSVWIPVINSQNYIVTATDPCGRTATTGVSVVVDCEIIVPNVFSPNNDGVNDVWIIEGITYTNNTVRVFNRWGNVVYEVRNYRNTWKANDVPDGTYFYEINVERHDKPYTGHVTILRNGW